MNNHNLSKHINQLALEFYAQASKPLQVETVINLVNGRNTFLLAGTGFGKSRIAEIYYRLIPKKQRAVILTLNPLDTLGDNQVLEKQGAGFTAINLSKKNFNPETAREIRTGVYQFIYLSPKIFLNNKLWDEIYFCTKFQLRLGLIVVDEAHMIFIWGLVASCKGTNSSSVHIRHADSGLFRPSYGNLGAHLLFCNKIKPILFLSATCRPIAVAAISKSLKLDDDLLDIIRGELTWPELRIIRVTMSKSLASSLDVIRVFPSAQDVSNEDMVPCLVYSGSRNRTVTVLEVIDCARETIGEAYKPRSPCARRYHSCTGDLDKIDAVNDYANNMYPVISCTMALGLGQNWSRVRMVVHMGRGDPANISQMIGRCGRDGRPGLAILFVEKNRKNGKNSVDQFPPTPVDEDRMDALAVTPVCLRIAFSIDNLYVS
jgi:ATP-dependent DNA helicase RecQ